ncbi:DNA replication licensing factor MCM3-like [Gordionus sp. m RMFG-2023]|uniref:DNA replication licensing factor MCM3-like n=1 Tax=Gordionus sp. m RMFG-2023 TaxID=3053472 RepID=UPI0031FE305F
MALDEQSLRISQRIYSDFLDDEQRDSTYNDKINSMIKAEGVRLIVNINDLRSWNAERALNLIQKASLELIAFQRALKDIVMEKDPKYAKSYEEFYIGLEGSFGKSHVTPRTLTSEFLGQIICIEGIVTRCSLIKPKVVRSVHYCPVTGKTIDRKYYDLSSLDSQPSVGVYPTKDEDGNLLETEFGLSTYKDHQSITLQELPEKAPPGQLPRSLDISCDDDLIDICKPGDRVQIVGLYKCLPAKKEGYTTATFRTILLSNNILELSKEISPTVSGTDVSSIKRFSEQRSRDVFEILARSLAPSIHGLEYVKKAVLCMLLGGVEKILQNGTRLRGDINILLIGDPSVAKSQILRYVWKTAPRAISTTGRGSSGVGLTASVVVGGDGGGEDSRRLEAGACVLADRGIVCVDEFDKMADSDRAAFHEVMEQGKVTVAKAGIRATLNARCSVLAAANPVYSRYDQYKTPMENIGMQDSLLSRFDLVFILLDQADSEQDQRISDHIVRIHQYRKPGERDGYALPLNLNSMDSRQFLSTFSLDEPEEYNPNGMDANDDGVGGNKRHSGSNAIYEKYDKLLHGPDYRKHRILKSHFLKKYIHLAKNLKPQLTQEATIYISEEYVKLRSQSSVMIDNIAKTQPITVRTLETLIRLSTAHAKARLSKNVELIDAQAAMDMVQYAYFKKVVNKPKKHKSSNKNATVDNGQASSDDEYLSDTDYDRMEVTRPTTDLSIGDNTLPEEVSISQDMDLDVNTEKLPQIIADDRLKQFKKLLLKIFDSFNSEFVELKYVHENINIDITPDINEFTLNEIDAALATMSNANQIMLDKGKIFRI